MKFILSFVLGLCICSSVLGQDCVTEVPADAVSVLSSNLEVPVAAQVTTPLTTQVTYQCCQTKRYCPLQRAKRSVKNNVQRVKCTVKRAKCSLNRAKCRLFCR